MGKNVKEDPRVPFFDRLAETWDEQHDLRKVAGPLGAVIDTFGLQANETVLDVGCGTGNLTAALLPRLGADGRVVAIDISSAMLERARQKVDDSRVTWLLAAADALPLAAETCNRIICFSAWPHFVDPAAVLKTFHRVLQSGGHVHVLHLISRSKVNQIHHEAHPTVRGDQLAPVVETAALFAREGFEVLNAEEDASRYLLSARKGKAQ